MPSLPIIEHLDVFKDILPRLFTGRIAPMVHQLALEGPEEAFDTGVVPAVALATHTGDEAVLVKYPLIARGGILTAAIRVVQEPVRGGRCDSAMVRARSARAAVRWWPIAQPITRREYRSSTTARSPAHIRFPCEPDGFGSVGHRYIPVPQFLTITQFLRGNRS